MTGTASAGRRAREVVGVAVAHPGVRDEPGPTLAVIEGLGALFVLTVMVGGLCSLFAWAVVQVVLVLAG